MDHTNWALEWLKIAQGLFGTLVGGGLVLLGGWLGDRRKQSTDDMLRRRRELALLTGMFAVRNFITERINEWQADGRHSRIEPLRTAQAYIHRIIDKAPGESESLMIAVIEIGLTVDALLATMDRFSIEQRLSSLAEFAALISSQVAAVMASLEQFDVIAQSHLTFLSDADLAQFPGYSEANDGGAGNFHPITP